MTACADTNLTTLAPLLPYTPLIQIASYHGFQVEQRAFLIYTNLYKGYLPIRNTEF